MDVGRAYSSVSPVLIRLVLLKYWPTAANTIGSYREDAIAIESEAGDSLT